MAIVGWDSFLEDVLSVAPSVPKEFATMALRQAGKEFFALTRIYSERLPAVDLVAGQAEYTLSPTTPSENTICGLDAAYYHNILLYPYNYEYMDRFWRADWKESTGTPFGVLVKDPTTIRLFPVPDKDEAGVLEVDVFLTLHPSTSTGIEDRFAYNYWDAFVSGALYRLFRVPDRPWSDMAQAQVHRNAFHTEVGKAIRARFSGFTDTPLQVVPRRWAV